MNKNKKIKIKYFVIGFLSAVALGLIIFGTIKLISNMTAKSDKSNLANEEVIDGYIYEKNNMSEKYTCDKFDDVWFMMNNYFVTNSGELYKFNQSKKFSETNQNCVRELPESTIKSYVNGYLVTDNGKKYRVDYNNDNKSELNEVDFETYNNYSILVSDDIKYACIVKEDYDNRKIYFNVIKADGILYKYTLTYDLDDDYNRLYRIENTEEIFKADNEIIKYFGTGIEDEDKFPYIVTDKSVYIPEPTNKKCEEYDDIKCEYKYVKSKYLNNIFKDIVFLKYIDDGTISYYSKTNSVYIGIRKEVKK
ncbi:MAG: hypothetical protein IJH20_04710 [Bacilli bacterium]|nr:hypothetical protein [Bacilli bacterium]